MRIIPKASKVKVTFYKGITIPDMAIALTSLALIAICLSTNFSFRFYLAIGILCLVSPLYMRFCEERLYVSIAYFFRYLFSKKSHKGDEVSTLIPYREVKGGEVYNKDGSLFGAIEISPINFEMLSSEKQDDLIDGCYANILNTVDSDEEWLLIKTGKPLNLDKQLHQELVRADRLSDMVQKGELSDKEYIPRSDALSARFSEEDKLNSSEILTPHYYLCLIGYNANSVKAKLTDVVATFASNGVKARVLTDQELYVLIRSGYATGFDERDQMKTVSKPASLSFGFSSFKEDGKQGSMIFLTRYPLTVPNGWAERLFSLPSTKAVMRMKPIEKQKALRRIDNAILEIETKNAGKESELQENDAHLETLKDLLIDIQQSNETLFDVQTILTVYDDPKSQSNRKQVKSALREMGFGFSELIGRQEDGYVSSLISKTDLLKDSHGIQSSSLAASFPFTGDIHDEEKGLLIGNSGEPSFIDFFQRDLTHVNSNLVVIGQSGSGKSYATKTILSGLATDGAKIFVLDPESEYGNLAKSLGGTVIDASNSNKGRINPFEILTTMDDEGGETNSFYAHLQFLEEFYRVVLSGIDKDSLEMLNRITEEAYFNKNIKPGTNLKELKPTDYPTFEDVCTLADQKLLEHAQSAYEEKCLRTLTNWLSRFKKGARDSALWNGYTTFSPKESFVDFDFQRLLSNHNEQTANAQMLLLLRYLENEVIKNRDYNRINHSDRKIIVAIDEAHLFIDEKYPIALDFMYQLAKRIRKYDGMLLIITQNVKDFAGTPEIEKKSSAIIGVSQYSMVFALSPGDMNELANLYQNAGSLNEMEKETIVHNPRGTCFFIDSPERRGILHIEASHYLEKLF